MIPLDDRLIIKMDPFEEKTAGGIVLPDLYQNDMTVKWHTATVVSVGQGRTTPENVVVPIEVGPGDRVLYNKYSGTKLKDDYEGCLLLDTKDVLCKIEEE